MRFVSILIGAAALTGCSATVPTPPPKIGLPPLPIDVKAACRDPGVAAGKPVLGEFAKTRAAFARCRGAGLGNAAFYDDLRKP